SSFIYITHHRPLISTILPYTTLFRSAPHDSGPMWVATPLSCDFFIHYNLAGLTGAQEPEPCVGITNFRLRSLFRKDKAELDLSDELQFHLQNQIDARVLGLTGTICLVVTLAVGLVPAFQTRHLALADALKTKASAVMGARGRA